MNSLRHLTPLVVSSLAAFCFVSCAHRTVQPADQARLVQIANHSPIQSSPTSKDSSPEALAAAAKRGAKTAAADIKAKKLRILEYGGITGLITKDEETGFPVITVAGCHFTAQIQAEADAYNKVMREWHAKNIKTPKPK